jgi:flagellar operon protein
VPETERAGTGQEVAFRQLLDESLRTAGGVKFSAHAVRRLESRGIELAPDDVQAVELALNRAAEKGARDSLVLADRYALVINVPSRTVITAFDQEGLQENVVTNIDSAVFVT